MMKIRNPKPEDDFANRAFRIWDVGLLSGFGIRILPSNRRLLSNIQRDLDMAQPIPLQMAARDPRAELQARLQNAPLEHAQALLATYEVLQGLHDRGVLELMRGTLGSSNKVIEILVEASKTPESIRGIRNLLILAKILGSIEPELLEGFSRSVLEALAETKACDPKPPGFWGILKRFANRDFRRGLVLINSLLAAFGRNLPSEKPK
jgi:uncharacterized protein YjgD (DUF1641 family)